MSHATMFDTLAYAKRLKRAGFTEKQAEVQAEAIAELTDDNLATRQDIKELEVKLRADMKMRLTIRPGVVQAASIASIAALVKVL